MSQFKSEFLNVLSERGFVHQISDAEALDAAAAKGPISGYIDLSPRLRASMPVRWCRS